MRRLQVSLVLMMCVTMPWALMGCTTGGGGGGGGQTDATPQDGTTDGQTDQNTDENTDGNTDEQTNDGNTETAELTEAEAEAAAAGYEASQSMILATTASQDGTDPDNMTTDLSPGSDAGRCPVVTANAEDIANLEFTVGADFGDGCTPLWAEEAEIDVTFSGSTTLSVSQSQGTANATFTDLKFEEDDVWATLDGGANLTYAREGDEVTLNGDWDLSLETSAETAVTTGYGQTSYDVSNDVAAIPEFDGEVAIDPYTWEVEISNIEASYVGYGSYIPYSGYIKTVGPDVGTVTVTFNEQSPQTGNVTIKVNNAPAITINLYTYLEYY